MIAPLKEFVIPFTIWLVMLLCVMAGIFRRAEWSLYLFAILAPLPNLWYPTHTFFLGKDTMDLLFASAWIGMWVQGKRSPATGGMLLGVGIVYSYISVWVVSSNYGLSPPVNLDNPVLRNWKNFAMMSAWFFLANSLISTEAHARRLTNIFIGVLLFMCWREISGFVAGSGFSSTRRAEGPFWLVGLNSNHYGAFVAQASLLALGLAAYETVKRRRWFFYGASALALYPLMYSYSRGAYAGFAAGLVVLGLLRYRWMLAAVLCLVPVWDLVLPSSVIERVTMTENADGQLEESAALRIVMWDLARDLFGNSPVFGIGFQGFVFASADQPLHNVHNYYLQMAAEQGVVGVVLLAATLLLGFWTGFRLWSERRSAFRRGLGLGVMAYTLCVVVVNVFGDRYSQLAMGSYFFLLLGMAVRMRQLAAEPEPEPAPETEAAPATASPADPSLQPGLRRLPARDAHV